MTTSREQSWALPGAAMEAPVWRPEMPDTRPTYAIDQTAAAADFGDDFGDPAAADDRAADDFAGGDFAATVPARAVLTPRRGRPAPVRRANSVTALLVVSAMVALGGVAFAVGRVTSTGPSGTGQTTAGNGFPAVAANASGNPNLALAGRTGGLAGAATVSGTVVGVTSSSITVQLASGQTVTVTTGSSTTYHTQTAATSSDVTQGATVSVKTSGSGAVTNAGGAAASASPGTAVSLTATDVTITGK